METKNKTKLLLSIMNVLFWIAFIGLCIQTGTITFSFLIGLMGNQAVTENLYIELDLSELYKLGLFHYLNIGLILVIISGLKAYIAFIGVKISTQINLQKPFSREISKWITDLSLFSSIIGVLQICAKSYYKDLVEGNTGLTTLSEYFADGGDFLFLAGIIFIIAQVFKRGLEIQSENELTI